MAFLLILLLPPLVTILVPQRFFGRYVAVTATLSFLILLWLGADMYRNPVGDPDELFGMIAALYFFGFNAVVVFIKAIVLYVLRKRPDNPLPKN